MHDRPNSREAALKDKANLYSLCLIWGLLPWWPLLGLLSWCLIFRSTCCNSFEDVIHRWNLRAPNLQMSCSDLMGVRGCQASNPQIEGLVQERCNSIANALELHFFEITASWHALWERFQNAFYAIIVLIQTDLNILSDIFCVDSECFNMCCFNNKLRFENILLFDFCVNPVKCCHHVTPTHSISQPPVHPCFARAIKLIAHPKITPIL